MRKIVLILGAVVFNFTAIAQNKPLIFNGSEIGYFNEDSIPVVTSNLTKEQADSFRDQYKDFIYEPKSSNTLDDYAAFKAEFESKWGALPAEEYADDEYASFSSRELTPGEYLEQAGVLHNGAIAVSIVGGVVSILTVGSAPAAAGVIAVITSVIAGGMQIAGNSCLVRAGRELDKSLK